VCFIATLWGESEGLVSRSDRFNFKKKNIPLPTDYEVLMVSRDRLDILG